MTTGDAGVCASTVGLDAGGVFVHHAKRAIRRVDVVENSTAPSVAIAAILVS